MNVLTLLACRPLKVDTVVSERIDPSRYEIGRTWSWLRRRLYPSARGTCSSRQSESAIRWPV